MLEIKPDRYFKAMWFVEAPDANWLAALYRDLTGPWTFVYRFRYFWDDKAHDSKDKFSWYELKISRDEPGDIAAANADKLAAIIAMRFGSPPTRIDLDTADGDLVMDRLSQYPWFNARKATPEDLAQINGN